jgi:hypothetical protein
VSRPHDTDTGLARQARQVAVVLVATAVLWMLLTWAGGLYGWPARFAFLIDLLALAGFAWALIVSLRLWRARRNRSGDEPQAATDPRPRPRKVRQVPQARGSGATPWFETLGVARDADEAEIRAAFEARAREIRPRRDKDRMRQLARARNRGLRTASVRT